MLFRINCVVLNHNIFKGTSGMRDSDACSISFDGKPFKGNIAAGDCYGSNYWITKPFEGDWL